MKIIIYLQTLKITKPKSVICSRPYWIISPAPYSKLHKINSFKSVNNISKAILYIHKNKLKIINLNNLIKLIENFFNFLKS